RARGASAHGAVAHAAGVRAAQWHGRRGGVAAARPVDRFGRVGRDPLAGAEERARGAAVVAVQSANHEVGTRQPVAAIAAALEGVPLLCDAAASLPWEPVPEGWSLLAASARKWGGPAGCGILVVRKGTRWRNPFPGEDASLQE